MNTSSKKKPLNATEKALEVVVVLTAHDREMGNSEISEITGFHKSTTSRVLSTLVSYGLVSQNALSKKYYLGPLAYKVGHSGMSQFVSSLIDIAKPHMERLRDRSRESINLEVWTGNGTIACFTAKGLKLANVDMPKADILAPHAAAGAKAVLSVLPEQQVDELINDKLESYTAKTISTKTELKEKLSKYRDIGYAIDDQELYEGVFAIGMPITDFQKKPIAAVCAVMQAAEMTEQKMEKMISDLKKITAAISKEIRLRRLLFLSIN